MKALPVEYRRFGLWRDTGQKKVVVASFQSVSEGYNLCLADHLYLPYFGYINLTDLVILTR